MDFGLPSGSCGDRGIWGKVSNFTPKRYLLSHGFFDAAMPFPQRAIDDIRSQADIVRVISDYVTLKKRGSTYVACCPFHQEKTPSFNVHPGKQVFKCFGCNVGGNVFTFVMKADNASFMDAVRTVADKCGLAMPVEERTPDARQAEAERDRVLQLNEWAAEFFENQLELSNEGRIAREYLEGRGIDRETVRAMRLGYSPDSWDSLSNFLRQRGASISDIERSGLVTLKENGGGFYDRFRGRVMFPISDAQGRTVAFGGRVLGEGEPKYLNSPETSLYVKGRHLYGMNLAKEGIRKLGYVILVEGYLDFLIPFQAGIPNIVASLGTALTEAQVRQLRRYLDNPRVVVNFDADKAGQAATRRSLEMFLLHGFKVNVLTLPEGKDPDGFVRANGVAAYRDLLKTSQPLIDYLANIALFEHDVRNPAGKAAAVNAVLPYLVRIKDSIERNTAAERLADRLKIDDKLIREELRRAAVEQRAEITVERVTVSDSLTHAERQVLTALLACPDLCGEAFETLDDELIGILGGRVFFHALRDLYRSRQPFEYQELCAAVGKRHHSEALAGKNGQIDFFPEPDSRVFALDAELENMVAALLLESDHPEDQEETEKVHTNLRSGLDALERRRTDYRSSQLHAKVQLADRAGDQETALQHASDKLALRRQELAARLERMRRN